MKYMRFSLAIAIAFLTTTSHAQQSTSQSEGKPAPAKAVAVKKAKAEPAVAAPSSPPVAPPPPHPFSPAAYKEGAPLTDYMVNDPQKVYEWLQGQKTNLPGKPDQYSTSEERQKYESAVKERMETIGQLPIPSLCVKKYDGDTQTFDVKTLLSGIDDIMLSNPNPEALRLRKMTMSRANQAQDTYKSQNGYGASVEVSKATHDEYAFSFPAGQEPPGVIVLSGKPSSLTGRYAYSYTFNHLILPVKMEPARARDSDKQIACLSVVTLTAPYVFKFTERSTPTRDLPFERRVNGFSMLGRLDKFIVFNKSSGEIYAQASR